MYIQTTNKERSIESAKAHLDGLYFHPINWPDKDTVFEINTILNAKDDWLMQADVSCPMVNAYTQAASEKSNSLLYFMYGANEIQIAVPTY